MHLIEKNLLLSSYMPFFFSLKSLIDSNAKILFFIYFSNHLKFMIKILDYYGPSTTFKN